MIDAVLVGLKIHHIQMVHGVIFCSCLDFCGIFVVFLHGFFGSWAVASSPVADWVHVQMPKPFCPSFQFLEQGQPAAETIRKYFPEQEILS